MKNWIQRMVLFAAVTAMPLTYAHSNDYLEKGEYQDAYSMGNGKVHIKQLVFAEGAGHNYFAGLGGAVSSTENVENSNAYCTYNNGNTNVTLILVEFEADNSKNKPGAVDDRPKDKGWIRFKVNWGSIQLTNDYEGSKPRFSADNQWHEVDLKRSDSGDHLTYFEYDWYTPSDVDNKSFVLYSGISRHRSSETHPYGRCYISCMDGGHQAIEFGEDRQPRIIGAKCVGCHLCRLVCPTHAMGMAKRMPKLKNAIISDSA